MAHLLRDQRGTATVEYLVILVSFTIACAAALYAMGPGLVELFQLRMAWLGLPFP
jgi:Flp pilus assembly pilin Flp